jgi:predicted GH43/DUF377 family glycosyl hydrolase
MHNNENLVSWYALLFILMGVLMTVSTGLVQAEILIPKQSDWTDQGVAITEGPPGSWDVRLSGMISPCTVVKKDGFYFLYYIGADGDRSTDGGPRHRALGVATSTDGINFTKYSGNPILTHLPHNNEEEGIFSCGATLDVNGDIILYYGALDAGSSTSESVDSDIRLAVSSDGFNFTEIGDVVSHSDSSVWGYGDELFPVGVFQANGQWYVYYIAKGVSAYWDLGLAWGPSRDSLSNTKAVLDAGSRYVKGGCDPIAIASSKIALFVLRNKPWTIEVRTASTSYPGELSAPVETYDFGDLVDVTAFLDKETSTWFIYYLNEAGDAIRVKTTPVVSDTSTTFDTGRGTYPSISGTHNGTITPTDDITVQKMYTYPCPGTGGHSEYVRIWNASGTLAEGNWSGYEGDWHTISFDNPFILNANETYNYTIRTGSYPQIIHKPEANVTGGTITCEEFVDANGKGYNDWIPAIKLYSAEVASASSNITNDMDYVHAGAEGDTEPPATDIIKAVLYNSYNSAVKRLFKALESINELYNLLF